MTAQLVSIEVGPDLDVDLDLDCWAAEDLVALARRASAVLLERFTQGVGLQELARFEREPTAGDWGANVPASVGGAEECPPGAVPVGTQDPGPGSLPALQRSSEELSRAVGMLLTALAGHTEDAFDQPALRRELLGLPEGRTAYRDAPDYLRDLLKVGRHEARQRVRRAAQLMPRSAPTTGEVLAPPLPVLSEASCAGSIGMPSVDLVTKALTEARQEARLARVDAAVAEELVLDGERTLTEQAAVLDADSLRSLIARWTQWVEAVVNPDGTEPTDAQKQHHQGMFYVGPRHGLHQWLINADELQHEVLSTVAHAANNPRSPQNRQDQLPLDQDAGARCPQGDDEPSPGPEPRSARQRHLDGIVSALSAALAMDRTNGLPDSGGVRPQVLVTVDHLQLWPHLKELFGAHAPGSPYSSPPGSFPGAPPGQVLARPLCEAAFSGPISATTARTLACDAEIVPVVLGGDGEILDVGAGRRLFPPELRRAVIARDGGCTAPGCSMPVSWCDVHHVQHWEHGGPTSVENGALLCSHHHHAVHAGAWEIQMDTGRPWFIPAAYLDPERRPVRNRHWRSW